ncbi:hypothetical protein NKG94_13140 [Micromonospora sp. M12]
MVTEAYQRLTEEGTSPGEAGPERWSSPRRPRPHRPAATPAPVAFFPPAPDTDTFEAVRAVHAAIDLSPGVPDLTAFPRADWLRAEQVVLRRLAAADLGYGDPCGAPRCGRPSRPGWPATAASASTPSR